MSIRSTVHLAAFLLLAACGGTQTDAEPTGGSVNDCPYDLGDSCITEDNLAQCQAMSARCPGSVMAMESCPLQFACP